MIRVAILGAGIGAEHLAAYRALPDLFRVTTLADTDTDRARALLLPGEDIAIVDTIDAALAADVDVIDICLPPHLHVPTTLAALDAGKHAICEKPLATRLVDCDALQEAETRTGKSVFPVFQYRWAPTRGLLSPETRRGRRKSTLFWRKPHQTAAGSKAS